MANVSFNEESVAGVSRAAQKRPLLVGIVLSTGIVRTDKHAEYVLMGIAVLAIVVAIMMWPRGKSAPELNVAPIAGPSDIR